MKPDELAAAVERLRLAETDFAAAYADFAECSGQRLLDYVTVANAYLAREADDAKPVDMQAEVMRWHDLVYPDRRPLQVAKKLLEEASECHIAAKEADAEKTAREAADCAIIAYVLANMGGFDLPQLMREKLAILINRADQQAERDRERGIED